MLTLQELWDGWTTLPLIQDETRLQSSCYACYNLNSYTIPYPAKELVVHQGSTIGLGSKYTMTRLY
jgi:hypothetical protein